MFKQLMNAMALLTTTMQAGLAKNAPTQIEHTPMNPKQPNEPEQPQQLRSELGVSTSTADGVSGPQVGMKKIPEPLDKELQKAAQSFERTLRKYVRNERSMKKLHKINSEFNELAGEKKLSMYPKGVRAFKSVSTFKELDEVYSATESRDWDFLCQYQKVLLGDNVCSYYTGTWQSSISTLKPKPLQHTIKC